MLEAEARHYRERVALLRARLYGRGLGSPARLAKLERGLERAEDRLRAYRRTTSERAADEPAAGERGRPLS